MKKTLSTGIFPVWVAQWEQAKFAGLLPVSLPERQSFHEQRIPESGHQSLSPARPSLFFFRALFQRSEQLPKVWKSAPLTRSIWQA